MRNRIETSTPFEPLSKRDAASHPNPGLKRGYRVVHVDKNFQKS